MGLESLAEIGFLRRERIVRAPDADSAGTWGVVDVLEIGEVGVRRLDGVLSGIEDAHVAGGFAALNMPTISVACR